MKLEYAPYGHLNKANELVTQGKYKQALEHYLTETSSEIVQSRLENIASNFQEEDLLRISKVYDTEKIWLAIGDKRLDSKKYEDAENAYITAINKNKEFFDAWDRYVNVLLVSDKTKEAEKFCNSLTETYSNNSNSWLVKARYDVKIGDVTKSLINYQKALDISSGSAEIHREMAQIEMKLGRSQDALSHFKQEYEKTGSSTALSEYVNLYLRSKSGSVKNIEDELKAMLKSGSADEKLLVAKAVHNYLTQSTNKKERKLSGKLAAKFYDSILEQRASEDVFMWQANLMVHMGKSSQARKILKNIKSERNKPGVVDLVCYSYINQKKYKKAIKTIYDNRKLFEETVLDINKTENMSSEEKSKYYAEKDKLLMSKFKSFFNRENWTQKELETLVRSRNDPHPLTLFGVAIASGGLGLNGVVLGAIWPAIGGLLAPGGLILGTIVSYGFLQDLAPGIDLETYEAFKWGAIGNMMGLPLWLGLAYSTPMYFPGIVPVIGTIGFVYGMVKDA